ncbi:MAG: hypothetical protein QOH81_1204 [Sphingomonadales bacterium]|jgi:PAS domain S-box-containing protein|nr:hypothetical protein [Sphingomonadales bacterium]
MPDLRAFLAGGGEMARLIRETDWAATPLGRIRSWPQPLRASLSIALRSPSAAGVLWGPDLLFLYNDSWSAYLGDRHPWALGQPVREVMADIWPALESQIRRVCDEAETVNAVDMRLVRNLGGRVFDSYWTYSLLPIGLEDGTIGGVLAQARETTEAVEKARQDHFLLELTERLRLCETPAALLDAALSQLGRHLGAIRTGYGEIDPDGARFRILACWTDGKAADISGDYPVGHFHRAASDPMRSGRTIAIEDGEAPGLLSDEARAKWRSIDTRAAIVVPQMVAGRYGAVLFAHDRAPRSWTAADEALLAAVNDRLWQYLSRARAEAALRRSEERYRRIFEQSNDLIFTADLDQMITACNPATAEALGLPREALIGRSIRDFVSEEGFEQTTRMLRRKVEHGGTTRHEIEVHRIDGQPLCWEINSALTMDESGRPIGLHAIARDVTDRRKAEERQRLLVNELNHRVKNTLALVQGLALQSFRDGRPAEEARAAFQERLAALAAAHDLLTRESWEGATLTQLVEGAIGHHNEAGRRIDMAGAEVTLGPKAAVSLVMALHELATNAAKYGALSVPGGRVALRWTLDGGDRLRLEWRETDGPEVRPPETRGFGLRMIERALSADLGAAVHIDFEPSGLVCRIEAAPAGRAA